MQIVYYNMSRVFDEIALLNREVKILAKKNKRKTIRVDNIYALKTAAEVNRGTSLPSIL